MIKKKGKGFYVAVVVVFAISVLILGLEGYLMAPVWGWKAMLVWVPFTALTFRGSFIPVSFLVDAMNRWVIPRIIQFLEIKKTQNSTGMPKIVATPPALTFK